MPRHTVQPDVLYWNSVHLSAWFWISNSYLLHVKWKWRGERRLPGWRPHHRKEARQPGRDLVLRSDRDFSCFGFFLTSWLTLGEIASGIKGVLSEKSATQLLLSEHRVWGSSVICFTQFTWNVLNLQWKMWPSFELALRALTRDETP